MNTHVTAIILAAGIGSRMNLNITKQRIMIRNESVLRRTVRIFNECVDIDSIIVVTRADELDFAKNESFGFDKVKRIVEGGDTRLHSAKCGFDSITFKTDFIAVHDAARCFVTAEMISDVVNDAKKYGAATASTKITDTVKMLNGEGKIDKTISRDSLVLVQTPQIFREDLYKKAIYSTDLTDTAITDDNMMLERLGIHPYCTETGKKNIKITTKEDLFFAEFLLSKE